MNLQECYEKLHGNYQDALGRLMNDKFIDRFILKFPADDSMSMIEDGIKNKDWDTAFRGAHTLKGVAANLAFSELQANVSDLTEHLRGGKELTDPALLKKVEDSYHLVIDTLHQYENEK